jgi:hypothetical protein
MTTCEGLDCFVALARNYEYLDTGRLTNPTFQVTPTADITGFGMRFMTLRLPIALALAFMALALGACSHRGETPANNAALAEDDDTFCRAGGKVAPGSPEYVACRKDRDAQRGNTIDRADKKQRDLGEYMLNHPSTPY